jgi:hypothetical protein
MSQILITNDEWISVYRDTLKIGEGDAARRPLLQSFWADMRSIYDMLRASEAKPTGAQPVKAASDLSALDRRAEASVRLLRLAWQGAALLPVAQGREADVAPIEEAEGALFPEGLAFLRAAVQAQTGATERLLERANLPTVAAAAGGVQIAGQDHAALLALIAQNNDALSALDQRRREPSTADPGPVEALNTPPAARRRASSFFSVFLRAVEQEFSLRPDDALRAALVKPFQEALARAATRA